MRSVEITYTSDLNFKSEKLIDGFNGWELTGSGYGPDGRELAFEHENADADLSLLKKECEKHFGTVTVHEYYVA